MVPTAEVRLAGGVVRRVVNRKEVAVRGEVGPPRRIGRVLAPKSVAKFDVSARSLAQVGGNT